jgi:parvulin-like peptidyl-prolyl isomerase
MSRRKKDRPAPRWGWRKAIIGAALAAVLGGLGWWARLAFVPGAVAQPTPVAAPAAIPEAPPSASDYSRRVVAYLYETEPVTREELGEYLIARRGPEKLGVLVNKRVIERACRERGIEVTAGEVDSALAETAQGLNMDAAAFRKTCFSRYRLNMTEWKQEVLLPRLLLTKLCRDSVRVSADELQHVFEATYGEKFEGRIILYPNTEEGYRKAAAEYNAIRASADAFEQAARNQYESKFSACAGKVKPFGRWEMEDPVLDQIAFRMNPGEISQVISTNQGPVVLQCLGRLPADKSVRFEDVRDTIFKDLVEKKTAGEMAAVVPRLKEQARPDFLLTRPSSGSPPVMRSGAGEPRPNQVVAVYNGGVPITREELGEYLITCFGEENLEFLVNRKIIDKECAARHVSVSEPEIDAGLKADLKKLGVAEGDFVKEFLGQYKKTLYEYREDAVRPRLLLTRLSQDQVRVTEADLRKTFEGHYGERLQCRMIMWPEDQLKFALADYPRIRDSDEAFAQKAKQQPSATLAAKAGQMPIFGRWTLDDPVVEQEAFKLQPGEVSSLIGTPQGHVVIKCDRRIPPTPGVTLEQKRAELEQEVRARNVQVEMGVVFGDLQKKAHPQLMLRDSAKPVDLKAETSRALSDLPAEERTRLGLPAVASPEPGH